MIGTEKKSKILYILGVAVLIIAGLIIGIMFSYPPSSRYLYEPIIVNLVALAIIFIAIGYTTDHYEK